MSEVPLCESAELPLKIETFKGLKIETFKGLRHNPTSLPAFSPLSRTRYRSRWGSTCGSGRGRGCLCLKRGWSR